MAYFSGPTSFQPTSLPSNDDVFSNVLSQAMAKQRQNSINRTALINQGVSSAGTLAGKAMEFGGFGLASEGARNAAFMDDYLKRRAEYEAQGLDPSTVPIGDLAKKHRISGPMSTQTTYGMQPNTIELRAGQEVSRTGEILKQDPYNQDVTTPASKITYDWLGKNSGLTPPAPGVAITENPVPMQSEPLDELISSESGVLRPLNTYDDVNLEKSRAEDVALQEQKANEALLNAEGMKALTPTVGGQEFGQVPSDYISGVSSNLNYQPPSAGLTPQQTKENYANEALRGGKPQTISGGLTASAASGSAAPLGSRSRTEMANIDQQMEERTLDINNKERKDYVDSKNFDRVAPTPQGEVVKFNSGVSNIPMGPEEKSLIEAGINEAFSSPTTYSKDQSSIGKIYLTTKNSLLPTINRLNGMVNKYGDLQQAYNISNTANAINQSAYAERALAKMYPNMQPEELRQLVNDNQTLKSFRSNYAKSIGNETGQLSNIDVTSFDFMADAGQYLSSPENFAVFRDKVNSFIGTSLYANGIKYNVQPAAELGLQFRQANPIDPNLQTVDASRLPQGTFGSRAKPIPGRGNEADKYDNY